jgi:hypothetical protein
MIILVGPITVAARAAGLLPGRQLEHSSRGPEPESEWSGVTSPITPPGRERCLSNGRGRARAGVEISPDFFGQIDMYM